MRYPEGIWFADPSTVHSMSHWHELRQDGDFSVISRCGNKRTVIKASDVEKSAQGRVKCGRCDELIKKDGEIPIEMTRIVDVVSWADDHDMAEHLYGKLRDDCIRRMVASERGYEGERWRPEDVLYLAEAVWVSGWDSAVLKMRDSVYQGDDRKNKDR